MPALAPTHSRTNSLASSSIRGDLSSRAMPLHTTTKDLLNVDDRFNRTRKKSWPSEVKPAGSFRFPNGEIFHPRGATKYDRRRPAKIGYQVRNSVSMSTLPTIKTSFDAYPDVVIPNSAPSSAISRDDAACFAHKNRLSRLNLLSPAGSRSSLPSMLSRLGLSPSLLIGQAASSYIGDQSTGPRSIRCSPDILHLKPLSPRPPVPPKHPASSLLAPGPKSRTYTASKLVARQDLSRQLRSRNSSDIPTIIDVDTLQRENSHQQRYSGSMLRDRGDLNSSSVSLRNHAFKSNNILRANSSDESPTSNLTVNSMENDDIKRPDVDAPDTRQDSMSLFYSSSMEMNKPESDPITSSSDFTFNQGIAFQKVDPSRPVSSRICTNEASSPPAGPPRRLPISSNLGADDTKVAGDEGCDAEKPKDSSASKESKRGRITPFHLHKASTNPNASTRLAENVSSSLETTQAQQQSPYIAGKVSASDSAIDQRSSIHPILRRPLSIRGVPLTPVLLTDAPSTPTSSAGFSAPQGPSSSIESPFYSPHGNSSLVTLIQEDQPDVPARRDLIEIDSDAVSVEMGSPTFFDAKEPPMRLPANGPHAVRRCRSLYSSRGWGASESNLERCSSLKVMEASNEDPSIPRRSAMRPLSLFRSASESAFGLHPNSLMVPIGVAGSISPSSSVYLDVASREADTNLTSVLNTPVKAPHINSPSHIPLVSSPRPLLETPKISRSAGAISGLAKPQTFAMTPLSNRHSQSKIKPVSPKSPPKVAQTISTNASTPKMTRSKSFNIKALCKRFFGRSSKDDLKAHNNLTNSKGVNSKAGASRVQSSGSLNAAGSNGMRSSMQKSVLTSPAATSRTQTTPSSISPLELRLPELVKSDQDLLHDVITTLDHFDEASIPPITRESTILPFLHDDELTSAQIQDQKIMDETRDDGLSEDTSLECVASISSLHNEYIDDNIRFLRNEFGWYRLGEKELAQELNDSADATNTNFPGIARTPPPTDPLYPTEAPSSNAMQPPAQLYPEYLKYARQLRDLPSLQVTVDKFKEIPDGEGLTTSSLSSMPTILKTKNQSGKTTKLVGFSAQIRICETFSADSYKRYNKAVTQYSLTDEKDILIIKLELNKFKCNEMLVHEKSQQNTHFFY